MKILILLLALTVPLWAEDWTVAGKDYHNVKVGQVEADRVHITYDGGIGTIMLSDLTPELQKRFNFDPAKVREAAQKLDAEKQQAARQQQVYQKTVGAAQTMYVQVIQVLPNGILADIWSYPDDGRWINFHAGYDAYVSTGKIIFIQCDSSKMTDDEKCLSKAYRSGTFTYQDTLGASRTIEQWIASN